MQENRMQRNAKTPSDVIYFPTYIFRDRSVAVLEAIVSHLKEKGMTNREIGRALNRDERTVWTAHHRVEEKRRR